MHRILKHAMRNEEKEGNATHRYTLQYSRNNYEEWISWRSKQVDISPMVSKVEIGDLKNSSNDKQANIVAGSKAYLDVKAYDQYGLRVMDKTTLNKYVFVVIQDNDLQKGDDDSNAFVDSVIGDDAADLKLHSVSDGRQSA
jgi:hypothetical protein